ncbi:MAG TPA: class I SAM-dependent methyltransferase [Actinomycetota bacterium]|nr:class I SAM-dependent methyltransferase [Actinomycetota bacterium]
MTVAMGSGEARDTARVHPAGSWAEGDLVDRWIAGDSLASVLELPRRIAAALVHETGFEVRRVVDVGAGTGAFLRVLLEEFAGAEGVWVDASEAMLERAKTSLADLGRRVTFAIGDLREPEALPLAGDVVVSARAIHHFRPEAIERFYRAAADALSPGGFLVNVDHFATPGDWGPRYRAIRPSFVGGNAGGGDSHSHDAPPQPLDDHLHWLREAGFEDPDVPWRFFWTALVVARTAR